MKFIAALVLAYAFTYAFIVAADVGATRQLEAYIHYCTEMGGKSTAYIDCSEAAVAHARQLLSEEN